MLVLTFLSENKGGAIKNSAGDFLTEKDIWCWEINSRTFEDFSQFRHIPRIFKALKMKQFI